MNPEEKNIQQSPANTFSRKVTKHVLIYISVVLYFFTGLILLSGIPNVVSIISNPSFSDSTLSGISLYIPLILIVFIVCIHVWVVWNVIKRKHITLFLVPLFELYFLSNLYFFLKPFSGDKVLVFDSISYAQLLMFSAMGVLIISFLRLLPIVLYRKEFTN